MTLVEVVASLALLGGLLGGAVVAKTRLTRQWQAAQQRASAVAALDAQLEAWRQQATLPRDPAEPDASAEEPLSITSGPAWPTSGGGPLSTEPWWWRAEQVTAAANNEYPIQVTRFTAYNPSDPNQTTAATLDLLSFPPPPEVVQKPSPELPPEAPPEILTGTLHPVGVVQVTRRGRP